MSEIACVTVLKILGVTFTDNLSVAVAEHVNVVTSFLRASVIC